MIGPKIIDNIVADQEKKMLSHTLIFSLVAQMVRKHYIWQCPIVHYNALPYEVKLAIIT